MTPHPIPADAAFVASMRTLCRPGEKHWIVAVSGGADSTYLLEQAAILAVVWPARIHICHINFGLRGDAADRDERLVRSHAMRLNLPLHVATCSWSHAPAGNLQHVARRVRRAELLNLAGPEGLILMGHQAWDQSETVLAALLKRKAPWGAAGLRARFGKWVRPLLGMPADLIRDRCRELNLTWAEDDSNRSLTFERNVIRHKLLAPTRLKHGDEADALLADIAATLQLAQDERDLLVDELLGKLDLKPCAEGCSLERAAFLQYHESVACEALRRLHHPPGIGGRSVSRGVLQRWIDFIVNGFPGRVLPVDGSRRWELSRKRAWLVQGFPPPVWRRIKPGDEVSISGFRVGWSSHAGTVLDRWNPGPGQAGKMTILRTWRPGDRIRIGPNQHKMVADLMGEHGFPPMLKRKQLVLQVQGEIRWCPGLRKAWREMDTDAATTQAIWVDECV